MKKKAYENTSIELRKRSKSEIDQFLELDKLKRKDLTSIIVERKGRKPLRFTGQLIIDCFLFHPAMVAAAMKEIEHGKSKNL